MTLINLGKQGETNVRQVQLDVSRLVTLFGPGTVQLLHRRPGDVTPYPVALTRTGDVVTWTITAADTAYSGEGQAELQYFAGDSLAKSETYATTITASQGGAGPTPPEPQAGWVTQVLQAGTDAAEAAERAENAALHPPIIGENGNWWLWSFDDGVYVDSGTSALGSDADVTAENIEAALGFTPADAEAVTAEIDKLSNEKVDQNQGAENVGKIFVVGTDGNLVLVPMPEGGASGDVIGTLDESNNILLTGDLDDGTYTIKYEMNDGSIINIGSLVVSGITYVTVTNNLTNCTNSNSATQAVKGESYSATITADSGFELSSVEVTMGGSPVTVSGGSISIAEVTGDIVITAVAEEVKKETNFAEYNATNTSDWSIWINNARAGSDGTYRSDSYNESYGTPAVSNYVAVQNGDVIEFTAIYTKNKNSVLYDSTKTPLSSNGIGVLTNLTTNLSDISLDSNDNNYSGTFTINNASIAYVRIGGYVGTPNHPVGEISIKIKRNGEYL